MAVPEEGQDQKNIFRVVKVVPENHNTNSLYLQGPGDGFSLRKAGQYASIRIMRPDGWSEPHPFTISGAPEDELLRLTIKKAGRFTSAVPDLKPGAPVKCVGPLGVFLSGVDARPSIVMIAGGVGITPFFSVLRHFRNIKAKNEVRLFWANKTMEDAFCQDELKEMTLILNLTVVHCLSREDEVSRYVNQPYSRIFYESGRMSGAMMKRYGLTREAAIYLCGPPPMMEAVLEDMKQLGVDPAIVEREKFSW